MEPTELNKKELKFCLYAPVHLHCCTAVPVAKLPLSLQPHYPCTAIPAATLMLHCYPAATLQLHPYPCYHPSTAPLTLLPGHCCTTNSLPCYRSCTIAALLSHCFATAALLSLLPHHYCIAMLPGHCCTAILLSRYSCHTTAAPLSLLPCYFCSALLLAHYHCFAIRVMLLLQHCPFCHATVYRHPTDLLCLAATSADTLKMLHPPLLSGYPCTTIPAA